MNKDCREILNDEIRPSIITAIKGAITFGMSNHEMVLHNIRVNNEYSKCVYENIILNIDETYIYNQIFKSR
jgi:hypothetical protein